MDSSSICYLRTLCDVGFSASGTIAGYGSPCRPARARRALSPRFVRFAALFYGSLAVVAAVWCGLRGFEVPLVGLSLARSLLLCVLAAAFTISFCLLDFF